MTFEEYVEKMYGIGTDDLSDDDYDGLYDEYENEKPYWANSKKQIKKMKEGE